MLPEEDDLEIEIEDEPKEEEPSKTDLIEEKDLEQVYIDVADRIGDVDEDPDEDEDQDEKQKFGKRAQKRIRNLVQKRRELEGKLVQAEEQNRKLTEDLSTRQGEVDEHQGFAIQQYGDRLDAETEALEKSWTHAHEEGDQKELWDIQRKLARVESGRMDLEKWQKAEERKKPAEGQAPQETQAPAPAQEIRSPKPDKKATAWARNNVWFGKDKDMTVDALEVHRELIEEDGVDPTTDGYYVELDKRLKEMYPDRFKTRKVQSNVASGSRTAPKPKTRTIRLTVEEKARAERMGVPLERYAREKAALLAKNL